MIVETKNMNIDTCHIHKSLNTTIKSDRFIHLIRSNFMQSKKDFATFTKMQQGLSFNLFFRYEMEHVKKL